MIDALSWIVSALALVGVVLNIYKRKECFYVWAVTNSCFGAYSFYKTAYSQSALFAVYFVLAIWGIYKWRSEG